MKIPNTYNKNLELLIDKHTCFGICPNKYVINFYNIALELYDFLEENKLLNKRILEIGGRTFPLKIYNEFFTIDIIEERNRFNDFNKINHKDSIKEIVDLNKLISNYDIIIIHSDYIAEINNPNLFNINGLIKKEQKFYILNYQWENFEYASITKNEDGYYNNALFYLKWFNKIRNHMHLGYKSYNLTYIKILDLSPFY